MFKRYLFVLAVVLSVLSFSCFAASCPKCEQNITEVYYAPTCIHAGYKEIYCRKCGFSRRETLDPLGHDYYEISRENPTDTENGEIIYQCKYCDSINYEVIEAVTVVPASTAALAKTVLSGAWGLFGVYVPAFGFTFGQMWLGIALCSVSVIVFRLFLGLGGSGVSSRTSSTAKPKISDNRKGDEY